MYFEANGSVPSIVGDVSARNVSHLFHYYMYTVAQHVVMCVLLQIVLHLYACDGSLL